MLALQLAKNIRLELNENMDRGIDAYLDSGL
jgi:hypothetical protein